MKLTEVKRFQDKLATTLNEEQIMAIFEIIDIKTEQEMEKAIQKMESIKNDLIKWVIATIIAAAGLIIAIIKL